MRLLRYLVLVEVTFCSGSRGCNTVSSTGVVEQFKVVFLENRALYLPEEPVS